jgi:hypothetical protein
VFEIVELVPAGTGEAAAPAEFWTVANYDNGSAWDVMAPDKLTIVQRYWTEKYVENQAEQFAHELAERHNAPLRAQASTIAGLRALLQEFVDYDRIDSGEWMRRYPHVANERNPMEHLRKRAEAALSSAPAAQTGTQEAK